MYCTQHYWVSRLCTLCTLPQNTVNQKMCISLETCNTFCNKANWVTPHHFTWRWKLTHFTKCAVPVMWQGRLTPWRCKQKISPKCWSISPRLLFFMLSATWANFISCVSCSALFCFEYYMMAEVQKPSKHISQCIYACWPCTQIQNTIKTCCKCPHIYCITHITRGGEKDNQPS